MIRLHNPPGEARRRRKARGKKGPQARELKKTLHKTSMRIGTKAGRISEAEGPDKAVDYMVRKRHRRDYRIAVSHALNAAGLDPKADARLRADINRRFQRVADLNAEAELISGAGANSEEILRIRKRMVRLIRATTQDLEEIKGSRAAADFFSAWGTHRGRIKVVQHELTEEYKEKVLRQETRRELEERKARLNR